MKVLNKSHYVSSVSRVYNIVPDTNLFNYESSKRLGLFQRIYFEHLYTLKLGGISFFITCTYNDKSIPYFLGKPCFSYEHIRLVTNGALSKWLDRNFGARLRYFCACESGEGKGKRGLGNNPHYHFIFNVQPKHDKNGVPDLDNFKCPTADEFNAKIKEIWQGQSSFIRFQDARFGICKEGLNNGVITSADAFSYVGKYVIKDATEKAYLQQLKLHFQNEAKKLFLTPISIYDYYLFEKDCDDVKDLDELLSFIHYHEFVRWRHSDKRNKNFSYLDWITASNFDDIKVFLTLYDKWFNDIYVDYYADSKVSDYKNLYSGKPRYSKSLGIYGLNFIQNVDSIPRVLIPTSDKYNIQYPCLYYLRKLYYDVVICPQTGNPLYTLNELGKSVKLNTLEYSIDRDCSNILSYVDYVRRNDRYYPSKYKLLFPFITPDLVYHYSVYNLVYRYRHYDDIFKPFIYESFTLDNIKRDYAYYLSQNLYTLDYNDNCVFHLIRKDYTLHSVDDLPCFDDKITLFEFLDVIVSDCSKHFSDNSRFDFVSKSEHVKRIKSFKYNYQSLFE